MLVLVHQVSCFEVWTLKLGLTFSETDAITSPAKPQFFQPPSTTNSEPVFRTDLMILVGSSG